MSIDEASSDEATKELWHRLAYPIGESHATTVKVFLPGVGGERQAVGTAEVSCDGSIKVKIGEGYDLELLKHLIHNGSLLHISYGYIPPQPAHQPFH